MVEKALSVSHLSHLTFIPLILANPQICETHLFFQCLTSYLIRPRPTCLILSVGQSLK
mgnify:CR=1 FL=1